MKTLIGMLCVTLIAMGALLNAQTSAVRINSDHPESPSAAPPASWQLFCHYTPEDAIKHMNEVDRLDRPPHMIVLPGGPTGPANPFCVVYYQ